MSEESDLTRQHVGLTREMLDLLYTIITKNI